MPLQWSHIIVRGWFQAYIMILWSSSNYRRPPFPQKIFGKSCHFRSPLPPEHYFNPPQKHDPQRKLEEAGDRLRPQPTAPGCVASTHRRYRSHRRCVKRWWLWCGGGSQWCCGRIGHGDTKDETRWSGDGRYGRMMIRKLGFYEGFVNVLLGYMWRLEFNE